METKFTNSKKEKVAISTDRELQGITISVHAYGQKILLGNGEVLNSGGSAGDSIIQFSGDEIQNVTSVNIIELIEKAIEDFKNK